MQKTPNPQGKGLAPVLQELAGCRPRRSPPPKHVDQVSGELFTSLFVLNSEFAFRPVAGRSYWLYRIDGRFKLLLLGPDQWSAGHPGDFIAECVLQEDVTWSLALAPAAARDTKLVRRIEAERRRLQRALAQAPDLDAAMPVYLARLPFYRRLLAYGLGGSLRASMRAAGINALSYDQARGLLTRSAS